MEFVVAAILLSLLIWAAVPRRLMRPAAVRMGVRQGVSRANQSNRGQA